MQADIGRRKPAPDVRGRADVVGMAGRRARRVSNALPACAAVLLLGAALGAQTASGPLAAAHRFWSQRLTASAVKAFEAATRDPRTAAEAWEALGRIYTFKGWQQEGVFPGWHDEPEYRDRAIAALKQSLAIEPSRQSAAEALAQAESFAASPTVVPPAPPRPEVKALDAKLEAFRASQEAPPSEFDALLKERTELQADPAPYFTGAQIMLERRDYARATDLAMRGAAAAERFIAENESALRMSGKAAGARARSRAAALDILGAVALARMDLDGAARQLEEAHRLSRGQDFLVNYHLGELAMARRDPEQAQEHYLEALALTSGPEPLRRRAREALGHIRASLEDGAGFEAWLEETLAVRREARRTAMLRSVMDRPLPRLDLRGMDGRAIDLAALRGKVLLLNFFSSW